MVDTAQGFRLSGETSKDWPPCVLLVNKKKYGQCLLPLTVPFNLRVDDLVPEYLFITCNEE